MYNSLFNQWMVYIVTNYFNYTCNYFYHVYITHDYVFSDIG